MDSSIWTITGIVAAALTSFGFLPQVRKMRRTKSVGDISYITMFQFMAGNALWVFYGIFRHDVVIIIANIISVLIIIIGLFFYYRYRAKDRI